MIKIRNKIRIVSFSLLIVLIAGCANIKSEATYHKIDNRESSIEKMISANQPTPSNKPVINYYLTK